MDPIRSRSGKKTKIWFASPPYKQKHRFNETQALNVSYILQTSSSQSLTDELCQVKLPLVNLVEKYFDIGFDFRVDTEGFPRNKAEGIDTSLVLQGKRRRFHHSHRQHSLSERHPPKLKCYNEDEKARSLLRCGFSFFGFVCWFVFVSLFFCCFAWNSFKIMSSRFL